MIFHGKRTTLLLPRCYCCCHCYCTLRLLRALCTAAFDPSPSRVMIIKAWRQL